jgi:hypothetical protein
MMHIDWNYLYSIVALVIGGLAGFQGVYEKYQKDSLKASTTLPGFSYLLTRAAFPAVVFAILYGFRFIESKLLFTAFVCGTGVEAVLRAKVPIKQEQIDLLHWYQNLFLGAAAPRLAERKKNFLKRHLPQSDKFQILSERVLVNMDAWPEQLADLQLADLKSEVEKLKTEFDSKQPHGSDELDKKYRYKLGYLIYGKVGPRGFKTLLSS